MKKIIDEYKYGIKAIIKNLTGSYNEDIEQEVYIKTWKNQHKYTEQNKFKQWVNTITSNTCKDYLKSNTYKHSQITESNDEELDLVKDTKYNPEKIFTQQERQKIIIGAIEKLTPKFKEVIILYDMKNLNYEEISERIKCPVGTVKSRLYNARKELSVSLQDLL